MRTNTLILNFISRLRFSTKSPTSVDTAIQIKKFKESLQKISDSSNGVSLLENLSIKLSSSKGSVVRLSEICKVNPIDSYKAELTTFDPQVIYIVNF